MQAKPKRLSSPTPQKETIQLERVINILKELNLQENPDIILIDASSENKPSGSK